MSINKEVFKRDRRKDEFIRSGNRRNFERRISNRVSINDVINILLDETTELKVKLINIDVNGVCILSDTKLEKETISVDLNPYFDLKVQSIVVWENENKEEKNYIYGLEFKFKKESEKKYLKEILLLNLDILTEYARSINFFISNLELNNKVSNFFVRDIKELLKYFIDLESELNKIKNNEIGEKIYKILEEKLNIFLQKADLLVKEIDNKIIEQKIKQLTRAIIGHFLYKSTIMRRGIEKPRGYPGDYQIIETVYNNKEISKNGLEKYMDRYFLNDLYAKAIRGRKNTMRELIKKYLTEGKKTFLNLASGSVREIRELLKEFKYNDKANIVCIDQDQESIDYSQKELTKIDTSNLKIEFINGNILHLEKFDIKSNSLDIVYSIGIADYLQDRMLEKIFKDSFDFLKIGGELIFAYKDIDKYVPLPPNWFCDWNFVSRNEKEFIDLIKKSLKNYKYDLNILREEETGIIFFVVLTKRG
jgi:extracellular factor (EF) 3-hydroxypalmitic acid methyl ester biosynthesis protein